MKGRVPFQRPFWWRSVVPEGLLNGRALAPAPVRDHEGGTAAAKGWNVWQKRWESQRLEGCRGRSRHRGPCKTAPLSLTEAANGAAHISPDGGVICIFKVLPDNPAMVKKHRGFDGKARGSGLVCVAHCTHGGKRPFFFFSLTAYCCTQTTSSWGKNSSHTHLVSLRNLRGRFTPSEAHRSHEVSRRSSASREVRWLNVRRKREKMFFNLVSWLVMFWAVFTNQQFPQIQRVKSKSGQTFL